MVTYPPDSREHKILSWLGEANEIDHRVEQEIVRLVATARHYEISWQSIGAVLGMSRQAAWERFGRSDPHPQRGRLPAEEEAA